MSQLHPQLMMLKSIAFSENRTTELVGDKEIPVITSTLVVEKASPRHAGNYSCIVPERAKTTIAVHVLNGKETIIYYYKHAVHTQTKFRRVILRL